MGVLVCLDTFDITKSTEESCEGLLFVTGFGDVFYEDCALTLALLVVVRVVVVGVGEILGLVVNVGVRMGVMSPSSLYLSLNLQYLLRDGYFPNRLTTRRRWWEKYLPAMHGWHFYS